MRMKTALDRRAGTRPLYLIERISHVIASPEQFSSDSRSIVWPRASKAARAFSLLCFIHPHTGTRPLKNSV